MNKRTVYGGGGIMPDYFVPIDTTSGTVLHTRLYPRGVINLLANAEVDLPRHSLLEQYPDAVTFKEDYELSNAMVMRLKGLAAEEKIEWDDEEFGLSRPLIALQLKALIARDLYDSSAFYRIINEENDIFQEGLRIITDDSRYEGLLMGVGSNVGNAKETENTENG